MESLRGKVIKGENIGEKQGYPTANLLPRILRNKKIVKGVYIAIVEVKHKLYPGIVIVGVPGFKSSKKGKLEVYLIGYHGRLYKCWIKVQLLKKIRSLVFYQDRKKLLARIRQDIKVTKNYFKSSK